MMLAFATLLRAFPGCGWFVRRRWRTLGYMALGLAIGMGMTIAFVGFHASMGFIGRFGFLTEDNWICTGLLTSLGSFVSRLFAYSCGFPRGSIWCADCSC